MTIKKARVKVLQEINWFKPWDELFMLEWNLKYFVWKVEVIQDSADKDIKKEENKAIFKNKNVKDA